MLSFWHKKMRNQRGFTLVELMIVVAIIGILTAIAFPLYANIQARARVAKAQADVRTLASAVVVYSAHTGSLPGRPGRPHRPRWILDQRRSRPVRSSARSRVAPTGWSDRTPTPPTTATARSASRPAVTARRSARAAAKLSI